MVMASVSCSIRKIRIITGLWRHRTGWRRWASVWARGEREVWAKKMDGVGSVGWFRKKNGYFFSDEFDHIRRFSYIFIYFSGNIPFVGTAISGWVFDSPRLTPNECQICGWVWLRSSIPFLEVWVSSVKLFLIIYPSSSYPDRNTNHNLAEFTLLSCLWDLNAKLATHRVIKLTSCAQIYVFR